MSGSGYYGNCHAYHDDMSETQATPSVSSDLGPTYCIHCGQRIRRFGQTRRWCHDETGNVQCKRGDVTDDPSRGPLRPSPPGSTQPPSTPPGLRKDRA